MVNRKQKKRSEKKQVVSKELSSPATVLLPSGRTTNPSVSEIKKYAFAVLISLLLIFLKLFFSDLLAVETPFLFMLFAVIMSALYGGLKPGIVTTILSAVLIDYLFLEPVSGFGLLDFESTIQIISFLLEGTIVSYLINKQLRTQNELIHLNTNLEQLVSQRTASLQKASDSLKRSSNALEKTNDELQRSNKELQDFAYVASHDLQEPLRKIQSFSNLLTEEYKDQLPEGAGLYIERMQSSAGRMRSLIEDLLAFSRVSTKAQPFVSVDLDKVAHEVLGDLEVRIRDANAVITIEHLPTINADPLQIRQLFQNLIGNALKFHRPGINPEIRIYADRKKADTMTRIYIEDNGIGLNEAYKDKIFTIFERLHGRSEYEGTGIGLAVVKKIVDRHKGSIIVKSKEGVGTTFIISLPMNLTKGGV